jgi:N-methylhydantoinase A
VNERSDTALRPHRRAEPTGRRRAGDRGRYSVGIDTGGTFTDIVVLGPDGALHTRKVLTTPDDYGRGVVEGLGQALADIGASPASIERLVHATTVATNTIIEKKGAKTALLATRGFRDILEMRRLRIPEMYTLNYRKPEPLVPRRLRREIAERSGPRGETWLALDETSVHAALDRIAEEGEVEALAIAFLHSYANPGHEKRAEALARARFPAMFITCSSDLLPQLREYERTSTTVINAYLGPALERYFASLRRHLSDLGVTAPLLVMKSDGAIMTAEAAITRPAYLVESGPAAGVLGAARVAELSDRKDCLTLDMGGTTAKASMVEGAAVSTTGDYEVGAGINISSKLVTGGGYALKLPVIDLSEIGAGGGSIVHLDTGGLLHVGPRSAGAMPGPVAYGRGGMEPTFTDAMIVLGYLNPDYLVGGALALDAAKAERQLADTIALPLGKQVIDVAYGIYQLAAGTMVRAVKAVSTYRGRDPRDFTLFAFGGNGPVVATEIASLLEMRSVLIPANPGVFSAYGLLLADIEHELTRGYLKRLNEIDPAELEGIFAELANGVGELMSAEGYAPAQYRLERAIDLRYSDQAHELRIPYPHTRTDGADLRALAESFAAEHERTYGHASGADAVESVALRVVGQVQAQRPSLRRSPPRQPSDAPTPRARLAYFGTAGGRLRTPVLARADLASAPRSGPLIIEEYDATCVVPPGWRAMLDDLGNIELAAVSDT